MPEQTWAGCAVPAELLYDLEADVWVRLEASSAVIGMTDVAQTRCGRVVQVSWKEPGRSIKRGRPICVIESAKWVGPVISPLSGRLTESNVSGFDDDVAVANRDPYGRGWLVRLEPAHLDEELGLLVDGVTAFDHYRALIDANDLRCFRCEE